MHPLTISEYRSALASLIERKFGPKGQRPPQYTVAACLMNSIADLGGKEEFTAFLDMALSVDQTRCPTPEEHQGLRALRGALQPDEFDSFVRCAKEAWDATLARS